MRTIFDVFSERKDKVPEVKKLKQIYITGSGVGIKGTIPEAYKQFSPAGYYIPKGDHDGVTKIHIPYYPKLKSTDPLVLRYKLFGY